MLSCTFRNQKPQSPVLNMPQTGFLPSITASWPHVVCEALIGCGSGRGGVRINPHLFGIRVIGVSMWATVCVNADCLVLLGFISRTEPKPNTSLKPFSECLKGDSDTETT